MRATTASQWQVGCSTVWSMGMSVTRIGLKVGIGTGKGQTGGGHQGWGNALWPPGPRLGPVSHLLTSVALVLLATVPPPEGRLGAKQ